ncbi:hypothetical protein [Rariglobus hedericola]|uniref:Uncharacterized protein n=1 Tax=Rariglobus hedericola TaxID=2597822 RepID=A0A556QK61_9BACT|nr:hypothetical protein [Rariglobus hedericola]TSJ77036.1 hypothetical protein FPL22_13070 [Rariglobus hedericola]
MKALPLLLVASLVANAAFVTVTLRRTASPDETTTSSPSHSATTGIKPSTKPAASSTDIVSALKANDPEALRDLLRSAGLPDETVRTMVGTAIWGRYRDRMKALQPKPDPEKPWWKNDQNNWYGNMSREQRSEMRRLQREANDESTRVLGPNKDNYGYGWQDTRLSFLPEEKRKDYQEIEQDYQDLIQEVQQDMQGFTLPSDTEKIRFLKEEQKRDLAAILTPAELADYELRMSNTAQQLRWKMTKFDGSEDEYRKIFSLQKTFDDSQQTDAYGNPSNPQSPEEWKKRQESEKLLTEQIKASLGPERYADYVRSQNYEYQQLTSATKRLSLPPETAKQVYNLRDTVSVESQRIADNESLGMEQKKQAFADLATRTREQVRSSLGAEAAEVYLKSGMTWLNNVEQGQVITFSENGQQQSSKSGLSTPKKKTTPSPPATKP